MPDLSFCFLTTKTKEDLRVEYQNKCMIYEEALDALKSMELDLTGLESVEELCLRLEKYVLRSDMKNFYMIIIRKRFEFRLPIITVRLPRSRDSLQRKFYHRKLEKNQRKHSM